MQIRLFLALFGSISLLSSVVNATPKRHSVPQPRTVQPDLVISGDNDPVDAQHRTTIIKKIIVNHSKIKYSLVALTIAFYDEQNKLLAKNKFVTYDLAPGATWKTAIPVSFLGTPPISEYEVLSLSGIRNGKSIISYKLDPNDGRFHFRPALLDATLDPAADASAAHYVGPTVDSLFTNPDLSLLQADFAPANNLASSDIDSGADGIATLTGVIENISDKTYDYVEVDANAYDYTGGTQIDRGLANTTSLAPHEKWRFTVHFLNGKEALGWRITKITGRGMSH